MNNAALLIILVIIPRSSTLSRYQKHKTSSCPDLVKSCFWRLNTFFLFFITTVKWAKPFLRHKHLVSFIQAHSNILTVLLHLTFSKWPSNLTNSFLIKQGFLGGEWKFVLQQNRGEVFQPTSLFHRAPRLLLLHIPCTSSSTLQLVVWQDDLVDN